MHPSTHSPERSAGPPRHAWVCFCLVLFLVYNPYMAAPSSTSGFNVRHPASNRATVGASELQHFSPTDGRDSLPATDTATMGAVESLVDLPAQPLEFPPERPSLSDQFLGPGLWFRPPPAL
jgi:hypothetical protein